MQTLLVEAIQKESTNNVAFNTADYILIMNGSNEECNFSILFDSSTLV